MKLIVPDYYPAFKCIDRECTDSCCSGWEVDVDEGSYAYYETVTGEFGDRLRSVMSRDGGCHFILKPDRHCPFLNDTGLCDLFTELGEDKLCETCAMYPRYVEEYGSTREMGIAFSCKTAAELILTYEGKAGFITSEDNKPLTSYNDIDPRLYFALKKSRATALDIVQNRAYTVRERAALLLEFADKVQHSMNGHRYTNIEKHNVRYGKPDREDITDGSIPADTRYDGLDEAILRLKRKYDKRGSAIRRYMHMQDMLGIFEGLETVKDEFPEFIHKDRGLFGCSDGNAYAEAAKRYISSHDEFADYYGDREYEFEHIMVYYIFRYFLKAVYDGNLLGRVKLAVAGLLVVLEMDVVKWLTGKKVLTLEGQVDITHLYSREVEHSDVNFARLEKMYDSHEIFSTDNLMTALLAGRM